MQAGIFEYGNGVLSFNAGGGITATSEYLPNPYLITYNNIPVRSTVSVSSMAKTDWQGTYTLSTSARTNLVSYSEQFDNAYWLKTNLSVPTPNAIIAPNGIVSADKIVEASGAGSKFFNLSALGAIGNNTFTVWAKYNGRRYFWVSLDSSATAVYFDLMNGAVAATGAGNAGSIASYSDGWFRCSVTRNAASAPVMYIGISDNSSSYSYTGDGASGIYLWGAQLESGALFTSYIPTTSAAVTATDYSVTAGGIVTLGTNYWPGQYAWTGTGTVLPYCTTGPTNRYNRMGVGISGLGAETVSVYPSYDGQIWESTALRPIDLSTGAVYGSTTLANGTYRIHDTPWKQVLFMASAATSGAVRYSLLNAN